MGNCWSCTWNGHTMEEVFGYEDIGGRKFVTRELG